MGNFHISNVCEIFRSVFRPLCEIVSNFSHPPALLQFINDPQCMAVLEPKRGHSCLYPRVPQYLHLHWRHTAWSFLQQAHCHCHLQTWRQKQVQKQIQE